MKNENIELKTTLDENLTEKFKAVKEHMGVNSNQSVIGLLVSTEFDRIQNRKLRKVFLPKETLELAEKAAKIRNQTLDEYIEELTLRMIENAKKGGNKKLLIGSSVYETLEARAKIQDLPIEAYIELLINTTAEEGVQHAEN
jgi:hypothetical protein